MPEEERPGTVIVAIVTDGLENASKEWQGFQVKELVEQQQRDYSWVFTYLGANQDAISVAHHIGINPSAALTYGTADVAAMSASLGNYGPRPSVHRLGVAVLDGVGGGHAGRAGGGRS